MTIQEIIGEIVATIGDPAHPTGVAIQYGHGRRQEANLNHDVPYSRAWLHEVLYREDVTDSGLIYDVVIVGLDLLTRTELYHVQEDGSQDGALQRALNAMLIKTKELEHKLRNHPYVVNKNGVLRVARRPLYNAYDANLTGWTLAMEVKLMPTDAFCLYDTTGTGGEYVTPDYVTEGYILPSLSSAIYVANAYIDGEGNLIIQLSNGVNINAGAVVGEGGGGSQGPQGEPGTNGTNGENGLSAYEIAVDNGFEGTEAEWLLSLVGAQGVQGEQGEAGPQGEPGAPGADGVGVLIKRSPIAVLDTRLTATGTIPHDDTRPLITEGVEILTLNYTPASATSKIVVCALMPSVASTGVLGMAAALFKIGTDEAIAAAWRTSTGNGHAHQLEIRKEIDSVSLTPIDFTLRVGSSSGASLFINGSSTTRMFDGAIAVQMWVEEYSA